MRMVTDEGNDLNEPMNIGGGLLDEDFLSDEEDENYGRKSRGAADIDIGRLKKNLKDDSSRKKKANRSFHNDDEQSKVDSKNTIVGICDVRKALKKNVF